MNDPAANVIGSLIFLSLVFLIPGWWFISGICMGFALVMIYERAKWQ